MLRNKPRAFLAEPPGYRWFMFIVMGLIYFFVCLHRISTTVLAPDLIREFGADATALGLMSSAYFYLYAAVQPPVGLLSDTLGPRRVISSFTLLACLGTWVFGTASDMRMATVGRALIGIGVGGVFIPSLKTFSRWFNPREFASITGLFLAAGNAGNLFASLPLTYLILLLGWRNAFLAIGCLSFMLAIVCWGIVRDKPEDKGWHFPANQENPDGPFEQRSSGIATTKRLKTIFSAPNFWMVTVCTFCFGGPSQTFQGLWAVPYLMDVHGYSRVEAGSLLMMLPLGFISGAAFFGFFADRVSIGRRGILFFSLGLGLGCWGALALAGDRLGSAALAVLFVILGSSGGGSLNLALTITKELFPAWLMGTAVGLMNPAAFLATALFQPLTGFLMDSVGRAGAVYPWEAYSRVFLVFLISIAIAFAAIVPLSAPREPSPTPTPE